MNGGLADNQIRALLFCGISQKVKIKYSTNTQHEIMAYSHEEYSCPSNIKLHRSDLKSEIIGYFSVDEHRNFMPDSSELLYYNPPEAETIHLDLNQGIESTVQIPDSVVDERLNHLLEWIKLNRSKIKAPVEIDRWIKPNFICTAGVLPRVLSTPFLPNYNWTILAAKWKGTIYLYSEKIKKYTYTSEEKMAQFCFWGHKFQQYVLSEIPDKVPDTSTPIIQNKAFRCVYQCRFGDHEILFDNGMKGVCSEKRLSDPLPLENLKFIKPRTSIIVKNIGQEKTLQKFKFLNWWSRAFLTNTESILCGFRDNDGIVRKLKTYSVDEMVTMADSYWNPWTCVDFVNTFLTKIAESVVNDCNETIYRFEKKPRNELKINEVISITKLSPSSENTALPSWYIEETQKRTE